MLSEFLVLHLAHFGIGFFNFPTSLFQVLFVELEKVGQNEPQSKKYHFDWNQSDTCTW